MLTDAEMLIRYAEEKSETAFAELVRRYVDLVYSAAVRQVGGDAHRAQDVTQVVFTTLARKAGLLTHHPVLAAWLYTTTHHAAAKAIRTEMRRQAREQRAHAMNENLADDDAAINWEQLRPVLDEAMRHLHERDREAVLLRYLAQRPFAEIGATMKVSEDAARMRVERALGRLRERLARHGVTSTSAALGLVLSANGSLAAPVGLAASVTSAAMTKGTAGAGAVLAGGAIMGNTKMIMATAAVVAALAVGWATREIVTCHAVAAALVRAEETQSDLLAKLRQTEGRAVAAEHDAAATDRAREGTATRVAPRAALAAGGHLSDAVTEPREAVTAADALMARHPAVKQALVDWHSAKVRFQFAPLFESLALTPEEVETFVELVRGENLFGEWGPNGQFLEFWARRDGTAEERRGRLIELLGEAGLREHDRFQWLVQGREFTAQLASQLCLTDAPLTPEQARRLVPILAEPRPTRGGGDEPAHAWEKAIAQASAELLPSQIAVLRTIFESERKSAATHEVQKAVARASGEPTR